MLFNLFKRKTKPKPGFVYLGESTRKDGSKKIYTGMTTRTVKKRWSEHIKGVKSSSNKTWTSRGTNFKPLGAVFSRNPRKAEQTIKKFSKAKKKSFARYAARKYRK